MSEFDLKHRQHTGERVALLEARVAQLEAALLVALGERGLAGSAHHFAKTQKMATLDPHNRPVAHKASRTDSLGITAAFASLDAQVAEAAEHEFRLTRKPDLSSPVIIDPDLIEDHFARARGG